MCPLSGLASHCRPCWPRGRGGRDCPEGVGEEELLIYCRSRCRVEKIRADNRLDCRHIVGYPRSIFAAVVAQQVRMMSAPARRIPVRDSMIAGSRSIQPFWAAALIIAYSPDT